ncbi:MAG: hypothetical protein HY775_11275 [Acidobacteria bacterium]|nr:hypothetical protein [Acidobacteriota bacterium]
MRKTALIAAAVLAAGAIGLTGGPGFGTAAPAPARARAWAVRIAITSQNQELLQAADASSEGGSKPTATAVPGAIGGQSPFGATASPEHPFASSTPLDWQDSTGSGYAEGSYAEARVEGPTATARTGFSSVGGTGFAVANMALTWDQQEQLMNQWIDTNHRVFDPLNAEMDALGAALSPLGIRMPHFEPMAGLGWIDVLRAQNVSSGTETTSAPGFSSARARTSLAAVRLFGGFIEAEGISAEAVSESAGGTDDRRAVARIAKLRIAGVETIADSAGIRVAGNDLLSRAVLQPVLDAALGGLQTAGVTIRVLDSREAGDLREASALQIEIASPGGTALVSIAHAEASAASVGWGASVAPAAPTPRASEPPAVEEVPAWEPAPAVSEPAYVPPAAAPTELAAPAWVPRPGPRARQMSQSAVRSLRTSYLLLFVLGGLLSALVLPALARPVRPART